MPLISSLLILFLTITVPLTFAEVPEQQTARLSGSVEDENRQPVPGVEVTVHSETFVGQVSTNATGHHNYSSVINNVDASNFPTFGGDEHRAFTARLRWVGKK